MDSFRYVEIILNHALLSDIELIHASAPGRHHFHELFIAKARHGLHLIGQVTPASSVRYA